MRNRPGHLLLGMLAAVMLAGCEDRSLPPELASQPADQSLFTRDEYGEIAVVGASASDPLWPVIQASARRFAPNIEAQVRFHAPAAASPQAQIDLIRSLLTPNLRGLCVQVSEPAALSGVLQDAINRGVPVVSIGHPAPATVRVGHVGFDDDEIGRLLASAVAKALDDDGTIMVLHAGSEHPAYGLRLAGFRREIRLHPRIDVFAELDCRGSSLEARRLIRERMERYPRLDAWVWLDDWPLQDEADLSTLLGPTCKVVMFGGYPSHWPLLRSGRSPVVVTADFSELGAKAVQFCDTALREPSRFESRYHAPLRTVWSIMLDAFVADWNRWVAPPEPATAGARAR